MWMLQVVSCLKKIKKCWQSKESGVLYVVLSFSSREAWDELISKNIGTFV